MTAPGLLIGAARSGSGKTTLALGLMRALTRRGLRVSAVKCGPDYIDPAFHAAATGRDSLNLDSWAMESGHDRRARGAGRARAPISSSPKAPWVCSTARRAARPASAPARIWPRLLGWPILLAHDVSGQAQTAAAVIRGLASHDLRLKIAGVVANRVGSDRHRRLVAEGVAELGLRLFGALPRDDSLQLPERHLGLVQAGETEGSRRPARRPGGFRRSACRRCWRSHRLPQRSAPTPRRRPPLPPPAQRIAVARDEAFSFFYPHLAQSWRGGGRGARLLLASGGRGPPG